MIVELMLSPLTLAIVGGAALLFSQRIGRKLPLLFAGALTGFALVLMTPMAANLLVAAVEREGASAQPSASVSCGAAGSELQAGIDAAVMLTGGFDRPPRDVEDFGALSTASLERAFAFMRLEIAPGVDVVVVGGGPFAISEAEVVAQLLIRQGFDPARLKVESESRNTLENARRTAALLLPGQPRIILATDALHMPRAAFAFDHSGFELCRLSLASYHIPAFGLTALIPQASALDKSRRALHEIAGAAYYRLSIPFRTPNRNPR